MPNIPVEGCGVLNTRKGDKSLMPEAILEVAVILSEQFERARMS